MMKALKIIEYIIKVLVMLIVSSSIMVFHSFGLRFVIEFADELGYTDLWITIFEMSFLIIYFFKGWLLITVLGYVLFRTDENKSKELVYFADSYLNNALRCLNEGNIEGAKSEIKFALIKSGMKVSDEGNE